MRYFGALFVYISFSLGVIGVMHNNAWFWLIGLVTAGVGVSWWNAVERDMEQRRQDRELEALEKKKIT
jgi:hypothetical protein